MMWYTKDFSHIIHFCPQRDSGLWGALMIFCGLIGATIAGVVIDYTKKYKEVAVVTLSLAMLCFVWFTEVIIH